VISVAAGISIDTMQQVTLCLLYLADYTGAAVYIQYMTYSAYTGLTVYIHELQGMQYCNAHAALVDTC